MKLLRLEEAQIDELEEKAARQQQVVVQQRPQLKMMIKTPLASAASGPAAAGSASVAMDTTADR